MVEALKERMLATIQQLKECSAPRSAWLPIFQYGRKLGWLEPVTRADLDQAERMALLAGWHPAAAGDASTEVRCWLTEHVLEVPDHVLFWVKGLHELPVGMVGLSHFDFVTGRVEVGSLVRGVPHVLPGIMYCGVQTLLGWAFQTFSVQEIIMRVPADNARALRLCHRCGCRESAQPGTADLAPDDRPILSMRLLRSEWMTAHRLETAA